MHLPTRLTLIIHAKELKRTTNTGRLALAALSNSEMHVRGRIGEPLDLSIILQEVYQPILFYPADDALELNDELVASFAKPVQLLVPDGSWRQAGKIHYRHRELRHVPRVKISKANTTTEHLRAEHRPEGMATLEAIAHAFKYLESPAVGQTLMDLYHEKLKRTLLGRGVVPNAPASS